MHFLSSVTKCRKYVQAGENASVPFGREAMLILKQQMPVTLQEDKPGLCFPSILNSATDAGNGL
jgi:hypothetical protein